MQRLTTSAYIAFTTRVQQLREVDRERGLTTTEIAVLTFVLVAAAVTIGGLLFAYAEGRVDALPEDTTPTQITGSGE